MGPTWSSDQDSGVTPKRLMRPWVAFKPTMPQKAAGMRIDPPVSVPSEPAHSPAATATPEPLLEPPGLRSRFQGLLTRPKYGLGVMVANSFMLSLPSSTEPAARNRSITVAS